jgi:hypothetical protein
MSLIDEETFLKDLDKYIENAFDKSQIITDFDLTRKK